MAHSMSRHKDNGSSPSGKAQDFDSCTRWFESSWPSYGRVAQVVEHLTFNQVVRGSNPRTLTYLVPWFSVGLKNADVAELADALDSGSSSLKRVWVQIPSSAPKSSNVCSGIFCFSDLFGMTSIVPRTVGADSVSARGALPLLQTSRVAGEH